MYALSKPDLLAEHAVETERPVRPFIVNQAGQLVLRHVHLHHRRLGAIAAVASPLAGQLKVAPAALVRPHAQKCGDGSGAPAPRAGHQRRRLSGGARRRRLFGGHVFLLKAANLAATKWGIVFLRCLCVGVGARRRKTTLFDLYLCDHSTFLGKQPLAPCRIRPSDCYHSTFLGKPLAPCRIRPSDCFGRRASSPTPSLPHSTTVEQPAAPFYPTSPCRSRHRRNRDQTS